MKSITLIRFTYTEHGVFGVLMENDIPFALTIERPWLDNKKGESCIPKGTYFCERIVPPKFGDTFEVKHVPNRSAILFHKGNVMDDSHGCIIIGEQFEMLDGKPAVLASAKGFNEFMDRLKEEYEFKIDIQGVK